MEWNYVKLNNTKRRISDSNFTKDINLKPAHTKKIRNAESKQKNLKSLIGSSIILAFYKQF